MLSAGEWGRIIHNALLNCTLEGKEHVFPVTKSNRKYSWFIWIKGELSFESCCRKPFQNTHGIELSSLRSEHVLVVQY